MTYRAIPIIITSLFLVAAPIQTPFAHAQEQVFAEGTLWRAEDDQRIFVISNDRKRQIPNEAVFTSYGWKWTDVQVTDPETLYSIPDIRVVKTASDAAVFDIISGKRSLIHSEEEFVAEGFTWDEVAVVNAMELESYPLYDTIAPPATESPMPSPSPTTSTPPSLLLLKIIEAKTLLANAQPLYAQERRASTSGPLSRGDSGPEVLQLQKKLQELGYFPKTVTANGNFGPTTDTAVRAFQRANKISAIGTVGPQTMAALAKHGLAWNAGATVKTWSGTVPKNREVLLAAWNETENVLMTIPITLESRTVKVGKKYQTSLHAVSHTPGFTVAFRSGNGVNVQYAVTKPAGWKVLANRFPIFDGAVGKLGTFPPAEELYVPNSSDIRTPEIIAAGREYLDATVDAALAELRGKGVQSVSGRGLIADLTDPTEMKNIAIIEHLDLGEFRSTPDKHGVVNKIFAVLGANKERAFRFSGSSKGALGIAQFIRSTYILIRNGYPAAQLVDGFEAGMADHVNAFQAMALYMDSSGTTLESVVREKIASAPDDVAFALAEVRAAAYNGGAGRVKKALAKYGLKWSTAVNNTYGLRAETRGYLEKYRVVREILLAQ